MGTSIGDDTRLTHIEQLLVDIKTSTKLSAEKPEDDFIRFKEAAKILHLKDDRLYAIHKKYFKARKPGKHLLFSKKELLAYINGGMAEIGVIK